MTVLAPDEARRIAVTAQGLHAIAAAADAASVLATSGKVVDHFRIRRRQHIRGRDNLSRPLIFSGIGRPDGHCFLHRHECQADPK